jgi:hypothetical protein
MNLEAEARGQGKAESELQELRGEGEGTLEDEEASSALKTTVGTSEEKNLPPSQQMPS